ncbi:MAG: CHAT domain-containing tetratricopeptide repeat protein [Saprospiraceae bacterium]
MRYLLPYLYLCASFTVLSAAAPKVPTGARLIQLAKQAGSAQKRDSVQHYLSTSRKIYESQDSLSEWIAGVKAVARIYRDELDQAEEALQLLVQAEEAALWRTPKNKSEWEALAWLHVNIAYTYKYGLEEYLPASDHYEKAKQILVDQWGVEDLDVAIYIYQEWGNLKTMMGDFKAAEVLLNQFLEINLREEEYNTAAEGYSDQGVQFLTRWEISRDTADLRQAIAYFEKGLQLPDLHDFPKGLLHGNLVKSYIDLGQRKALLYHAEQAEMALHRFYQVSQYEGLLLDQAKIKKQLGDFFQQSKEYETALLQYQTAEKIYLEIYPTGKYRELARTYSAHAQLLALQAQWKEALIYHQKALFSIIGRFQSESTLDNPSPEQLRAERVIAEVLAAKAATLQLKHQAEGDLGDLELALECHELIYWVEHQIRASYLYERSKLGNIAQRQLSTEKAIDIAYTLWELTQESKFIDIAFHFVERNKSILLLEAFQKAQASDQLNGPSEVVQEDRRQQLAIAKLEKEIYSAQRDQAADSLLLTLEGKLLTLKQQYKNWVAGLAHQYPSYFNLTHDAALSKIGELQSILPAHQAVIEYFVGTKHIYAFVIGQRQQGWLKITKDFPLAKWVSDFRLAIEGFQLPGNSMQDLCSTYSSLGQQLYQKLFAPLGTLFPLPEQLMIIPSEALNYLPFEALLSQTANDCKFKHYPYLLLDHEIHYGFSATLQKRLSEQPYTGHQFLGLAPSFDGHHGFGALYKNTETIQKAQNIWGGQLLLREKATSNQFMALAPKHQIIHLATHAKANMDAGDFSFIVFADGKGGYDSLYTRDIYLLALDAEMVILSACETAVGQLHQGEGIISLARGFLYAGSRSVITTLWQINDEANYNLMSSFYAQLKRGKSKAAALRQAKIHHLQTSDNVNAHPAYWAAFVVIGNERAIEKSNRWLYLGMGGLALLVLGFILKSMAPAGIRSFANFLVKNAFHFGQ